jgi:tRNA G18 (ribose-2'-O)-methylase SpoU
MSFKPYSKSKIKSIKKSFVRQSGIELEVLLLDIEDSINIGSIIRSADGMGLEHLNLSEISMKYVGDLIAVTSMGLHRRIDLKRVQNLEEFILSFKDQGYQIIGLDITENSVDYKTYSFPKKVLLIVGNEKIGIYKKYFKLIDTFVHIPMFGKGPSLNAATAFAIVGFQICS